MNTNFNFPNRNTSFQDKDCFYIEPNEHDYDELVTVFEKKISNESINLKLQYFSIEKELINSFQYVNPESQNLKTSSVKFATIIREASNLFEQTARIIYNKLFTNYRDINIFSYLSLDLHLNFQETNILCPTLENLTTENHNILHPFKELSSWDKTSRISSTHIPKWWTAYNKIKHSPNEITEHSNLENAIRSLLASYIIIYKYLGPGVVSGYLEKPENNEEEIIRRQLTVEESSLFMNPEHLLGFVI